MAVTALQSCLQPKEWPPPPEEFSVSTLAEIEECPRRWALRHAAYDGLWDKTGYPPAPSLSALTGSAVHLALEQIAYELAAASCESAQTAAAVAVMRRLGGYSNVIERALLKLLDDLARNPRTAARLPIIKRAAMKRIPQLREGLQRLLARLRLSATPTGWARPAADTHRGPLGPGSYAELRLHAPSIGWRGTADLLTLENGRAEILDFKTGEVSDAHAFQLQVYALLWKLDAELNPSASLARRLIVAYPEADTEVPAPDAAQLDQLQQTVVDRTLAARRKLAMQPPPAVPNADVCPLCPVRHLCPEYWQTSTSRTPGASPLDDVQHEDVEIQLSQPEGPGMWSAKVLASASLARGSTVKVQVNAEQAPLTAVGRRLRFLGVCVTELEDFDIGSKLTLIVPSPWTEVFVSDEAS